MKVNFSPERVSELFQEINEPWWIAGGWAIDLFLGEITREHEDVDVAILRQDERTFRRYLSQWELWPGLGNDELEEDPITVDQQLPDNREVLWCRPSPDSAWAFELLLSKNVGNDWIFKRDVRIHTPVTQLGSITKEGIRYLNPEIVLLFKAKNNRDKDLQDFNQVMPRLATDRKDWLKHALEIVHPNHEWLTDL